MRRRANNKTLAWLRQLLFAVLVFVVVFVATLFSCWPQSCYANKLSPRSPSLISSNHRQVGDTLKRENVHLWQIKSSSLPSTNSSTKANKWRTRRRRRRRRRHRHRARRYVSPQVDEIVNKLRILESLDEQLRSFAAAAEFSTQQQQQRLNQRINAQQLLVNAPPPPDDHNNRQQQQARQTTSTTLLCQLKFMPTQINNENQNQKQHQIMTSSFDLQQDVCLKSRALMRQVPPYVLNLYRQLLVELHQWPNMSAHETIQLMPYKAQVMRSFRQPDVLLARRASGKRQEEERDYQDNDKWRQNHKDDDDDEVDEQFLNRLYEPTTAAAAEYDKQEQRKQEVSNNEALTIVDVVELSVASNTSSNLNFSSRSAGASAADDYLLSRKAGPRKLVRSESSACDARQRLVPAHERNELCFWFNVNEHISSISGGETHAQQLSFNYKRANSLSSVKLSGAPSERLVEAELHVFKLFPHVRHQTTTSATINTRANNNNNYKETSGGGDAQNSSSTSATNLYHLKTNLLEVSLYQILPRRQTRKLNANKLNEPLGGDEYPLRLLDIRRIDLNSNGWETFYVKRALEDWLRDARLNLGLVIRAKSMFDEPIKIGLIQFADAYDHYGEQQQQRWSQTTTTTLTKRQQQLRTRSNNTTTHGVAADKQAQQLIDFDLSHQPLLVIYTQVD